jgi:hypothetical protein
VPVALKCFSSVKELAPVFDHGGHVVFIDLMMYRGSCRVCMALPWEIVLRSRHKSAEPGCWITEKRWSPAASVLDDMKNTLLHEFVHLFDLSHREYYPGPKLEEDSPEYIAKEEMIDDAATALLKRDPEIMDEIIMELVMHPNCSFIFNPDARDTPFWGYYRDIVAKLAREARSEIFMRGEVRRLKILWTAEMLGL